MEKKTNISLFSEHGVITAAQVVETEQRRGGRQQKQASDTAAVLQDELIQAADRERQLQMQLDKTKDDVKQLQTRLEQLSNVQRKFDDFKERSASLWENKMRRRDSRCTHHHHHHHREVYFRQKSIVTLQNIRKKYSAPCPSQVC